MPNLPIKRMILYKHGVGYFERQGPFEGTALQLQFPREAMDDVLKSLIALDRGAGQVLGIDFETPEDRAARLARGSIHLSENRSLLDLLRDLRGRRVRLILEEEVPKPARSGAMGLGGGLSMPPADTSPSVKPLLSVEGLVVGVDIDERELLDHPLVTIYQPDERQIRTFVIHEIKRVELLEEAAAADLSYFLRASQSEEDRRSATVHLSPGEHSMLIGYIAPAPSWRVSYRMLFEKDEGERMKDEGATPASDGVALAESMGASSPDLHPSSFILLQGWGLFDNQLEEDLEGVELALVAGMPVSFRYRLYEPHTPERPLVEDEDRTVNAPVFFEAAPPPMALAAPMMARSMAPAAADIASAGRSLKIADMAESVQVAATGEERGALFAYTVAHPVSVARGQSAMVPILSKRIPCQRDLLYNGRKLPKHPIASLRLTNATGLTLERGPVTVLEDGDYAGEAVVPFTSAGGELIVPFAVELGINVDEQQRSERQIASISVRNEYLLFGEYDVQRRVYQLTSTLSEQATVMIEHPLLPNYELWQVREPDERTASVARWKVPCAPHSRTTFEVAERQMQTRNEQVRGLKGARLRSLLRDRFLDEATFAALEHVLALYMQADEAQRQLDAINKERQQIYTQQKQIQGSLAPLGKDGDEGALRQRYVTLLGQSEDQLMTLAQEEIRLKERIATLEREASEALGAVSA